MKKRFLILASIFLIASIYAVFSHEGEEEFGMGNPGLYSLSQLAVVAYGSIAFGILIVTILLFNKAMTEIIKKAVYILLVILVSVVTIYLISATLHLNIISESKGPVHWHADFEIWACGKELKLAEPKGMSNKQGTDLIHSHNDNRIHVEGVLLDKKEASLGAFFHAVNGALSSDGIKIPTDNGLAVFHEGDKCNEMPAKLYVFVNGKLIENPYFYVISPYEKVPPGDRIKFVFTEKPVEEINPSIR